MTAEAAPFQQETIGYVVTCPVDDWTFDARYTSGVCPVCGWTPEGGPISSPAWYQAVQKVDWGLVGLLALTVALIVLGVAAAHAAGLSWRDLI